jgi:hypothetical protein
VTTAQLQKVYRLADEGESLRAIALEVFGDKRFKDRVARLLRARGGEPAAQRSDNPHAELARLRVEILRANLASFERLRAMTREPPAVE